jgi:Tfp pilus assembly protein PilO
MTGRDRIVAMVVAVLVVVAAGWMLVVSPKRKEAKDLEAKVNAAQTELSTAESQLADARAAQSQYASAYAAVVNLGKAVPPKDEVASLLFQVEQASNLRKVQFSSIVAGANGSAPTSSGSSSSAKAPAAAASTSSAFTAMPFTFVFSGGFFQLEHLFTHLTSFTTHKGAKGLEVRGRLLTIQSVKLAPESTGTASSRRLTGTVTASAYVLPAGQALTAGATPASPSGSTSSAASSSSGSPTTPALARVP